MAAQPACDAVANHPNRTRQALHLADGGPGIDVAGPDGEPAGHIYARAQELMAPGGIARGTVYNVLNRLARGTLPTDDREVSRRRRLNAYQRRYRQRPEVRERRRVQKIASRRARGVPPALIAWPCGTRQAYDRHCRNRVRQRAAGIPEEPIDDACRRARREEYDQPYYRTRQLAGAKKG